MSEQMTGPTADDGASAVPAGRVSPEGAVLSVAPEQSAEPKKKKKDKEKKPKKTLEERKVYEAGGIIVCDGKVVMRLTDKQRWIFPKGKLKKHETAQDAALREATEETGLRVEVLAEAADLLIFHE